MSDRNLKKIKKKLRTNNYICVRLNNKKQWQIVTRFIAYTKQTFKLIHIKDKAILEAYLNNNNTKIQIVLTSKVGGIKIHHVVEEKNFIAKYNENLTYKAVEKACPLVEKEAFKLALQILVVNPLTEKIEELLSLEEQRTNLSIEAELIHRRISEVNVKIKATKKFIYKR